MENFDIKKLFNEPVFNIDVQKYINKYNKLLKDIDNYIEDLNIKIRNAKGCAVFGLMGELILVEYQREIIRQTRNNLEFLGK